MEAYSVDAVEFARKHFGYELDYSLESIRQLELMLDRFHNDLPKGLRGWFKRGLSEKQISTWAKVFGGYLGETMRRQLGGTWIIGNEEPFDRVVCLKVHTTTCAPPLRAYKRMMNGPEDNVYDYVMYLVKDLAKDTTYPANVAGGEKK